MAHLEADRPDDPDYMLRQSVLRMRLIAEDPECRGRARAGYFEAEQVVAAGVGEDLGLPATRSYRGWPASP